jgi:DNA-nicking Smr family endonuclease
MSGRRLSDDERILWKGVTRSIAPLRRRPKAGLDDALSASSRAETRTGVNAKTGPAKSGSAEKRRTLALKTPPAAPAPPLTPLTRKMKQRIARGADAVQGRLDLHGMTQDEAHGRLLSFLRGRQERGAKVVLVITGKGGRGGEEVGVLKRMVPLWLGLPELRGLVVGFEAAAIAHGGEGALYVRLRRATRG